MRDVMKKSLILVAIAATAATTPAFARRGADDPAGHIRQGRGADDVVPEVRQARGADDKTTEVRQSRGADDAAGDDRGRGRGRGRGGDDAPGHD